METAPEIQKRTKSKFQVEIYVNNRNLVEWVREIELPFAAAIH